MTDGRDPRIPAFSRRGTYNHTVPAPQNPAFDILAVLLRPQGRRGEILAEPHTPDLARFANGGYIVAAGRTAPEPGQPRTAIEALWSPTGRNAGRIVLKLAGCDSISAAELLAGHKLLVPADERPAPADPDSFYVADLVGCTLYDSGTYIGDVVDIEFATTPDGRTRLEDAAPLLVVEPPQPVTTALDSHSESGGQDDAISFLIPFIRAQLVSVDLPAKRITMNLPEGLLDL